MASIIASPGLHGWASTHSIKAAASSFGAAMNEWMSDKAPRMGAALAYYTIFSLAPLLVIATAIAGVAFREEQVHTAVISQIQDLVGPQSAMALETFTQASYKPGTGAFAAIISLFLVFIGASGVFTEMRDALNTIWEVKEDTKRSGVLAFLRAQFFSFGIVLGTGFLLLASLILSAVLSTVTSFWQGYLPLPSPVLYVLDVLVSLAIISLIFTLLFRFLPSARVAWADASFGGIVTALLFTLGKFLIGLYIGKSALASTYGAAASVVIIAAWAYYSAQIFYFGAELTRVRAIRRGRTPFPKENATHAPKPKEELRM